MADAGVPGGMGEGPAVTFDPVATGMPEGCRLQEQAGRIWRHGGQIPGYLLALRREDRGG